LINLSQVIGALTAKGYSVEFDSNDKGTAASIHGFTFVPGHGEALTCYACAVGPTPNIALVDCLKQAVDPRLTKLAQELLK
jgi:hypothetical protein